MQNWKVLFRATPASLDRWEIRIYVCTARLWSEYSQFISKSDPSAGINAPYNPLDEHGPVTTGEKVGAAFATLAVAAVIIGGAIWIVL